MGVNDRGNNSDRDNGGMMAGYNKGGDISRRAYKAGKTGYSIWDNIIYSVGGVFICELILGVYS